MGKRPLSSERVGWKSLLLPDSPAIPIAIYLILAFILILPILGPGYYLALDMQFGPKSFADFQFSDLYGFSPSPYGAYLPLNLAFAALSQIIPVEFLEKGLLLALLFLSGASAHFSLPKKLGNCRYFAGLLYLLNPFVYIRFLAGHWALLLSYAIWPLAVKFFIDFIESPGDKKRFAIVLLITSLSSISSHGLVLLLMVYAIIFLVSVISRKTSESINLFKSAFVLALVFIVINLFWVLPTILLYSTTYSPTASPASYLSDFGAQGFGMPLEEAILTMHGFWRAGFQYTKDVFSFWYLPFIVIAVLSLIGVFTLFKSDKMLGVSLSISFILAFLFSLGGAGPMLPIANALKGIPIYLFLRDSQKFVGVLALVYALAGAYGLYTLAGFFKGKLRISVIFLVLAIVIIYNFGFFGFLGQIGPTQYPDDWAAADKIISADPVNGNILVLPLHLYYTYYWVNGTQQDLGTPASQFFSKPVITSLNLETSNVQSDTSDPLGNYVRYLFDNRASVGDPAKDLIPLNVRYIIINKNDPNYIHYLFLFDHLGGVPNITKVFESPNLYVFRNDLVRGPIFSTDDNGSGGYESLISSNESENYGTGISYHEYTPATYLVDPTANFTVLATAFNPYLWMNGTASPWHGIANVFPSSSGLLENQLFYSILSLFILSWVICLIFISDASPIQLVLISVIAALIYLIYVEGIIHPAVIGWLLILSVFGAFALRSVNNHLKSPSTR